MTMTASKYMAVHGETGITVELVELVGPSGGWPEIKYTGDPDYILALAEIIYPDDDFEGGDTLQAPFVYQEAREATPGYVLEEVIEWLDGLGS